MTRSVRAVVAGLISAIGGMAAYQWMRNDNLVYGRVLIWGGWLLMSMFLYVAWGVVERHLRNTPTEWASDGRRQVSLLFQRSPAGWQWLRLAVVAYGSAVINLWIVNQIQFSTAAPWLIGVAVGTAVIVISLLWWSDSGEHTH